MNSEDIYEESVNYYTNLGKKLFDETVKWDEKEREYYLKTYWDWCCVMETAKLRGKQRGFEEGYAIGLKEISIFMVQKLKQMGLSIVDIAKATGLSEEEIRQL